MDRRARGGAPSTWDGRGWRALTTLTIAIPALFAIITGAATLAGRLNLNPGGWLAAAAAVVAVAQPAVRALSGWVERQREKRELERTETVRLRRELAGLAPYVGSVRGADPHHLGVAPSRPQGNEYVTRNVDAKLRESLRSEAFVVLTGDSGAGKSRTAFEAARAVFPDHILIAPLTSDVSGTTLRGIVELVDQVGMWGHRPLLLWLDNLDRYLVTEALTTDLLTYWAQRAEPVKLLATMQEAHWQERRWSGRFASFEIEGRDETVDRIANLLGRASRVYLDRRLAPGEERNTATRLYGEHDWDRIGLGEVLGAGPNLVERLNGARDRHPIGAAVVEAAVAWRRAGVGRPIRRSELEALSARAPFLPEWTGPREDFADGLKWACAPLPYSDIRLLAVRDRPSEGDARETYFDPHDYVVEDREQHGERLGQETWEWIIDCESVTQGEALLVGNAAYGERAYQMATRAYTKAERAVDRAVQARAMFNRGATLGELGRSEEAIAVYEEVEQRFGDAIEPELRTPVAAAMGSRGLMLGELGRSEEEILVYKEMERRFGAAIEPELCTLVATAMNNLGVTLGQLGRSEEEIAVYKEVERRFGAAAEPELHTQVARAMRYRGLALAKLGRSEEAFAVYGEVERRFGAAIEPGLRRQVARAMRYRAFTLGRLGRLEEAIAVYEEMERRFAAATEPELRAQVAEAMVNRGMALGSLGQSEEAIAVYEEVERRFGSATEPELRAQAATAMVNRVYRLGELGRS